MRNHHKILAGLLVFLLGSIIYMALWGTMDTNEKILVLCVIAMGLIFAWVHAYKDDEEPPGD